MSVTRSGAIFKQTAGSEATMAQQGEGDLTVAQVLQALLADLGQGVHRSDKKLTSVPHCDTCGKVGHRAWDCWSGAKQVQKQKQQDQKEKASGALQAGKVKKEVECFNCHQKGHMSYNCPNNAMLCEGAQVKVRRNWSNQEVSRPGKIKGKPVKDILLDTGCSRILVHKDHVPMGKVLEGEAVAIWCVHMGTQFYTHWLV